MVQTAAPIIPVFYHVNPAELQSEDGKYSQALRSLGMKKSSEGKQRYESAIIQKWREALASVASVAYKIRLDLEAVDGDEGELVDKVVEQVQLQLEQIPLDVVRFPTGLAEKVNDFETTVLPPGHSGILGIYGIGGVGKTTLATELFNRYKSRYSHSCFLPNIAETRLHQSLQTQFITSLQMQLLKGLFHLDLLINSSHQGTEKLRKRFLTTQVFVVLDDVDDNDLLDALLPDKANLRSGSLVLITSREKGVLASSGLEESSIYKLDGLNRKHSRELFCCHAFGLPGPCPEEYEDLVDQFLTACQGSPLFLKVYGALLYRKKLPYWQSQLDSVHRTLPHQIKERLMISYNALTKDEQNLFLDIACIYAGQGRDCTLRRLGQSYPHGSFLFQNLQNKCLVSVGITNSIQMHAHFQELGKAIEKEASGEVRLQRRRWTEDIELSVTAKLQGIEIYLHDDHNACSEITWYRGVLQIYDAQDGLVERILGIAQNSPNLASLAWLLYPYSSLASWIPVKNLRLLSVGGMGLKTLWKDKLQAPLQLRRLDINAPLENIPNSIGELKNLEVIRIFFSENPSKDGFNALESPELWNNNWWPVPLLRLPEEFCHLRSLKKLVLRGCTQMKSLPDSFGDLSNLEYLRLHLFESLERLPISFGRLIRLKHLYLGDCPSLTISAETLGDIRLLFVLGISRCSKIEVLPPQVSQQWLLGELQLLGTNLKLLPNSIGQLSNLTCIILESPLETLPDCFGDLRNLKMLYFKNCNELKFLPESAGCLTQLTMLELNGCHSLQLLPDSIGFLNQLSTLTVRDCHSLQFLPNSIRHLTQLTKLYVIDCHSLQILPDSIRFLTQLKVLKVTNCPCRLLPFERVARDTEETGPFPHHGSFPNLVSLSIKQCNGVVEIGTLPNSLEVLELIACNKLRKIDQCLCSLDKLRVMSIVKCNELEELPSMETLVSLQMLTALECLKLKSIRGIAQLMKLGAFKSLDVSDCVELEELPGLKHSGSLAQVYLPAWPERQWGGGLVEHLHPELQGDGGLEHLRQLLEEAKFQHGVEEAKFLHGGGL